MAFQKGVSIMKHVTQQEYIQLISKSNDYFTPASSKFSPFHNGNLSSKGRLPTVTVREFNPFIIPAHQSCHVILRR